MTRTDAFMGSPGLEVPVPLVSADPADDWDDESNNFERDTSKLNDTKVKIDKHKIAGFGITREQLATFRPSYWIKKAELNARSIGLAVRKDLFALVTGDNFGDTADDKHVVGASTAFTKSSIAKLRAKLVKRGMAAESTVVGLNPDYFAALLDGLSADTFGGREAIVGGVIPGLYGFRAIFELPNYAGPGFAALPSALATASRKLLPLDETPYTEFKTFTEPDTGMSFNNVILVTAKTGKGNFSVECNYGMNVGDKKALVRLMAS